MARIRIKKEDLHTPKGTRDILPEEYIFWQDFYDKAEEVASYYGFLPIQTPHFEKVDLFSAAVGESTDIVEKQMYAFRTRGGDRLVLRPEGTAPIVRAYFEHGMHTWPQPVMLWYKGSFFRHESPQAGRFREFGQFGLEILGEEGPIAEVTVIKVLMLILGEMGLKSLTVHINSIGCKECRSAYRKDLVSYYRRKANFLCKDCKRRLKLNPLRLLDCKELKCMAVREGAPQIIEYLCDKCKKHFKEVLEFLDADNLPYSLDNYLVRGLDYYCRTVFEIFSEEARDGNQETIGHLALASGGRYDDLGEILVRKKLFGMGGAIGVDRVIHCLHERNISPRKTRKPKAFLVQLGPAAKQKSLLIIEMFRKAKVPLSQSLSKDSIKSQLKIAAKLKVPFALIIGQKEAIEDTIIVRNMDSGSQEIIPIDKVVDYIRHKA